METDIQALLDFLENNNKLTSFAHPNGTVGYIMSGDELMGYRHYDFIEVFNRLGALRKGENGESQWDYILSKGRRIFAIASEDCHNVEGDEFNKARVMVRADSSSKEDILNSLKNGNFYASTGNDIEISLKDNTVIAKSKNTSHFYFIGQYGKLLKHEGYREYSEYRIKGNELYVRIRMIDAREGNMAWGQPVFIVPEFK